MVFSRVQFAQILRIIAGHGGEVGVELVVRFREEIAISVGEHASEFADELIKLSLRRGIEHDGQREISKLLAVAQSAKAVAKILDVLPASIHQPAHREDWPSPVSLPICEMNPVFGTLKWRRRLLPLCAPQRSSSASTP